MFSSCHHGVGNACIALACQMAISEVFEVRQAHEPLLRLPFIFDLCLFSMNSQCLLLGSKQHLLCIYRFDVFVRFLNL